MSIDYVEWAHPVAVELRAAMTAEMGALYGDAAGHQNRDGSLDIEASTVEATVLAWREGVAVGHGALRRLGPDLEVKRMYVAPNYRGLSIADAILDALESQAREHGEPRLILHTGERQVAAIAFYQRHGYRPIEVYPPYDQLAFSLCFEKVLSP